MKKSLLFLGVIVLAFIGFSVNWAISNSKQSDREMRNKVDTRIDNSNYWVKMAEKGYIDFNPDVKAPKGIFTGSKIKAFGVLTEDSPDIPVTEINSTQSENSVFVDPQNPSVVLNSNNSTQNPVGSLYGANDLYSFDAAESWEGEVQGAGGSNSGDPTTAIGLNGRWYVNYIDNPGGMGISYSDDQGSNWTAVTVAPNPGSLADKNHMWIDNSTDSPYEGNLYIAWTNFGGGNDTEIGMATSTDDGETWTRNDNISGAVNAGSHNQGVNIGTGPNGEVYAIWAIYDGWPTDEGAIGLAKSLDGGQTWLPATRIIDNIRGIRSTETSKNMRVNSFPACAVDCSSGSNSGRIYVTWANIGVPGVNSGADMDVYVIFSDDQGTTWSEPVKVNQDEPGNSKQHYFPWITVDPANGIASVIFYDDRNVSSNQAEVFCANSDDGGVTWEDFKVSDVSFTPSPIPGLASSYFGDYLGIIAQSGWVYPVWTDNRSGSAMTYCSPYQTNPLNKPANLQAEVTFETGATDLIWSYEVGENFLNFNIYRDDVIIGTATDTTYTDMLPDYGKYKYKVTAAYTEDMESSGVSAEVQWGDAHISVSPLVINDNLLVDTSSTHQIMVVNVGQLQLDYSVSAFVEVKNPEFVYCDALGGGDEYIGRVQFGDIDNSTGFNYYGDYTDQMTSLEIGVATPLIVTNANPYSDDQCGAWIDWNQNGEFDDDEFISFGNSPGVGPYQTNVIPPAGAKSGETRMRVRIRYTGDLTACGNTQYGEVEDYTVKVKGWLDIQPKLGYVEPGDTAYVDVIFDSHDMDPGFYSATAQFTSNDPDVNEVGVELNLTISSLLAEIDAESETLCLGEETALTTTLQGIEGSFTFDWSSVPEGFTSTDQNVVVGPDADTWFFVTATDTSGISATDSVFITVFDIPIVELGADTSFCPDIVWTLDAGNEGANYLWSTGETTQTISVDTTGLGYGVHNFTVEVTNQNGCAVSDEINLEYVDCTGINELATNIKLNVYPNPSNGVFNVSLTTIESTKVNIQVVSSNGKVVFVKENLDLYGQNDLQIDLSSYAKGMYQLIISNDKGLVNKTLLVK